MCVLFVLFNYLCSPLNEIICLHIILLHSGSYRHSVR
jgi:hypothetical protein